MLARFVAAGVLALAAVALKPAAAAAQDAPCDADPRWLLVTVIKQGSLISVSQKTLVSG